MQTTTDSKPLTDQDLMEGLAVNLKLSQDLLAALHEENAALKAMDTQGLFRISRQKDTLLAKIHYIDDSLRSTLAAQHTNPAGQTADRTRLIGQYQEKINAMRQEIQARNLINKRFTEDTLSYLSEAIALITQPAQSDHIYRIPGRSQARGRTQPSLISREV